MVEELVNELLDGGRRDHVALNADGFEQHVNYLKAVLEGQPHYDHDGADAAAAGAGAGAGGAPRRYVVAAGDPMIVDADGRVHHYWGSAVMVIFNGRGVMTALEYVRCTGDRNYINDVWRHDFVTGKYKFKHLDDTPGYTQLCTGRFNVEGPKFVVGDESWRSEALEDEKPPDEFLKAFGAASRTFFVNSETATFVQGPDFGVLEKLLRDSVKPAKTILGGLRDAGSWMQRAVNTITMESGYHWLDGGPSGRPVTKAPEAVRRMQQLQVGQFVCGLVAAQLVVSASGGTSCLTLSCVEC